MTLKFLKQLEICDLHDWKPNNREWNLGLVNPAGQHCHQNTIFHGLFPFPLTMLAPV